ncbi:MAG: hypothetical protein GXC73_08320 [Chitinophagaceae bacterium]|nr:hypothetical protein [Chitinophagaceae bacterium]
MKIRKSVHLAEKQVKHPTEKPVSAFPQFAAGIALVTPIPLPLRPEILV